MYNDNKIDKIITSKWLNADANFSLTNQSLGKITAVHAFQMLCPGCILHGIPQAQKIHSLFSANVVQVIGLHTVFEHHEAMQEVSLKAFLSEFRVTFPVGIDQPQPTNRIPLTMDRFNLQGTPSWLIFDPEGYLVFHHFGILDDMHLGSEISKLIYKHLNYDQVIYKTKE